MILAGLLAALAVQAWTTGVTIDEPSHLLSAYLYWHGADKLKPGDMPPLIKITGGWAACFFPLPIPYNDPVWATGHEWNISGEMLARTSGPLIQRVFFFSRLPLLVFPLLTALLVWRWGRELFGAAAGLLLALAYALEPTALAHGALFKNDLAATCTYLLFWYRAWRFWKAPRLANAAWLGAALLLALLSKLSMIVFIGIAPAIVLLRYLTIPRRSVRGAAAALALVLLIPYLGVLAAYQFDTRRLPSAELAAYARDPSLPRTFIAAASVFHIVPVARPMWNGVVSLLQSNATASPIYLLGKRWPQGNPLYFIVALAVKAPVPLQLLMLCGAVLLAIRWKRNGFDPAGLFWIAPGLLYIGLASLSAMQYGVRLVLPALPFGLLLCGAAIAGWSHWPKAAIPLCLLGWLALESILIFPHGISYFNTWSGGPENGLKYLADSNIDWGQDLPSLRKFIDAHGIRRLHLSYFGNDRPHRYFRDDEIEQLTPPWSKEYAKGPIYEPSPGYYAISANLLPGHFFDRELRDYYKRFRDMRPIGRAGYSIYVYRVSAARSEAGEKCSGRSGTGRGPAPR